MKRQNITRRQFFFFFTMARASAVVTAYAPNSRATASPIETTSEGNPQTAPSKFKESPMLAERVKKGELPVVDQRLPKDVLVVEPVQGIGQYGGTLRFG